MDDRRMQLANALMQPSQQKWMPQQQSFMGMQTPIMQGFKPFYPSMSQPQQAMPPQGFMQGQQSTNPNNYYQNQ